MPRGSVRASRKLSWACALCLALLEAAVSSRVRPPAGSVSGLVASLQNARPLVLGLLSGCRDRIATILPRVGVPEGEQPEYQDTSHGVPLHTNPPARQVPAFDHRGGVQGGVLGSLERRGEDLRERARELVDPERIKAATKRREVQLRAAFSSAVLLPLQKEVSPRVQELRETLVEQAVHVKEVVEDVLPHARTAKARKFADRVRGEDEVHRKLYCAAPLQDIVATCTDLENYQKWTGTGIKRIEVVKRTRDESVMRYNAGALGLSFDFTLRWRCETAPSTVPFVMTFQNVGKAGLIGSLNGAYIIDRTSDGVSTITFDFSSELASHIPGVVKHALGKMVVDIATQELKRHTEVEAKRRAARLPADDRGVQELARMRDRVDELEGRRKGRAVPAPRPAAA